MNNELEDGELRTSKGGFALAERNVGSQPLEIVVVEPKSADKAKSFEEPIGSFRYHDAAIGTLLDGPTIRAYEMIIASGGRTERHEEKYDRLTIALTTLHLRDEGGVKDTSELQQKVGDVSWWPKGIYHATTNLGTAPAHFLTVEFAQ